MGSWKELTATNPSVAMLRRLNDLILCKIEVRAFDHVVVIIMKICMVDSAAKCTRWAGFRSQPSLSDGLMTLFCRVIEKVLIFDSGD